MKTIVKVPWQLEAQDGQKLRLEMHNTAGEVCFEGEVEVQKGVLRLKTENNTYRMVFVPIGNVDKRTPTVSDDLNMTNPTRSDIEKAARVFLGRDIIVYRLSKEYDALSKEYFNKFSKALPTSPKAAKEHKNWKHFQRMADLIETEGYNSKLYLKAQFEALQYLNRKKHGIFAPLVNTLYSSWAIDNYKHLIQDYIARGLISRYEKPKEDLVYESVQASHALYKRVRSAYPEMSAIQCFRMVQDSLSPAFTAIFENYINTGNDFHNGAR